MHDHEFFYKYFCQSIHFTAASHYYYMAVGLGNRGVECPANFFGNGNQRPKISTALQCRVWQFVVKGYICFSEVL